MLNELESHYDCARAGEDLHQLLQELDQIRQGSDAEIDKERMNRIENQIHFIRNKCSIPGPQ